MRVVGELTPEFDETFQVNLTSPGNATIADGQAIGTILDNDARLTIGDVTINPEGNPPNSNEAVFNIQLTTASANTITVRYDTAAGTAASDVDFFAGFGTVTFAPCRDG